MPKELKQNSMNSKFKKKKRESEEEETKVSAAVIVVYPFSVLTEISQVPLNKGLPYQSCASTITNFRLQHST